MENRNEYRVPYNREQSDAHVDCCLYGMQYGVQIGSREYIVSELAKRGIKLKDFCIRLDDATSEFVVTGIDKK